MKRIRHPWRLTAWLLVAAVLAGLVTGSVRDPDFWFTADQRGDALMRQGKFELAARTYADPWRAANARYRLGEFKDAARGFARVAGAPGRYDAGNAWLMAGSYDQAITSYDAALKLRPGWKEAEENKALAIARRALMQVSDEDRAAESADAYDPDDIVTDGSKADDGKPVELAAGDPTSDAGTRALWLRRVQTTPADFLKAKFAYQASQPEGKETK